MIDLTTLMILVLGAYGALLAFTVVYGIILRVKDYIK